MTNVPDSPPPVIQASPYLAVQEDVARLRSEIEALQVASLRSEIEGLPPRAAVTNIPRHMAMLQALQKMHPKVSPERLMDLAERNIALAERDANLESRKVGVPLFTLFSLGFGFSVVLSLQTESYPAAVLLGTFTFLCIFLTAFFLGAPRAAIAFFADKAKATAALSDGANKDDNATG